MDEDFPLRPMPVEVFAPRKYRYFCGQGLLALSHGLPAGNFFAGAASKRVPAPWWPCPGDVGGGESTGTLRCDDASLGWGPVVTDWLVPSDV